MIKTIPVLTKFQLPKPIISPKGLVVFCAGKSVSLSTGTTDILKFAWSDGSSTSSIDVKENGAFFVTVTDKNTCQGTSTSQTVRKIDNPKAIAGGDTSIVLCPGAALVLGGPAVPGNIYSWTGIEDNFYSNLANPVVHPQATTFYKLKVTKEICTDTVSLLIKVSDPAVLFIPSAFSPNDDKLNEEFKAEAFGMIDVTNTIFNRWGEKIYEWPGITKGWNGNVLNGATQSEAGVYVYKISGKDKCQGRTINRLGTVTLVR